jgi:NAD(P)H-hydrate epimerase
VEYFATAAQMKELDTIAIQQRGISSLELMEQAAQAVAAAVEEKIEAQGHTVALSMLLLEKTDHMPEEQRELDELQAIIDAKNTDPAPWVAVFCGTGNNGGDGIAAARLLLGKGYRVRVFLLGNREKMTLDARAMEEKLMAVGGCLEPFDWDDRKQLLWQNRCDCAVDALFGVGLNREISGDFALAIQRMNQSCLCPVVSCDIPSGVHADTGEVLGQAVHAAVTVTFTCPKPGLYLGEGSLCAGEIRVADIGIPNDLVYEKIMVGERQVVMDSPSMPLPRRPRAAHKGDFGRVLILAGSEGYTGAPVLAARAAVRTGAGLVYLGVPREIYPIVAVKCDEAMPFPLPPEYEKILERAKRCDVVLIGPGLGRSPETERLVLSLLADLDCPVVLDADGINALAGHIDVLDARAALTVLTPHEGEFQRLTGCPLPVQDRLNTARNFAMSHGCILVLKGHSTVTADQTGRVWINTTGNPGMAKGGSGDVLAGMLAALLGQKPLREPRELPGEWMALGAYYHGAAGDLCAKRLGEYGMTPSDLVQALPEILKEQEE